MPTAQPTTQPPPPDPQTEQAALAALTLILLSGQAVEAIIPPALPILAALGIPGDVAKLALGLGAGVSVDFPRAGLAQAHIARTSTPRRAAYIVSAARRLAGGGSLAQERTYLGQHVGAERARVSAAQKVDGAAAQFGPVLGWRATNDQATTKACAAAHRHNFTADHPPTLPGVEDGVRIVGYPGTPHGGACRCVPVPAWPGATLLA